MIELAAYAAPFFLLMMAVEILAFRREAKEHAEEQRGLVGYDARDTRTSLTMGTGSVVINAFWHLVLIAVWAFAFELSPLEMDAGDWWIWPLLFVLDDLAFYLYHRVGHEVRVFWASHVVHHSSEHYNLSTALRQPWFTPITGPVFWLPLALLGYPPPMIVTAEAISLIYQFWIHTEAVGKLPGPLEWLFNTPSHHRVHHGKNLPYLDRNHAGVLIIWDRLFGTFAAEDEREAVRYGITHDLRTFNPLRIAVHELVAVARDLRRAKTFRGALGYLFAPPGWSPDGSSLTAAQLRRGLKSHFNG